MCSEPLVSSDAPPKRRRRSPTERDGVRRAIVDAVQELHREGGLDAITMRSVAKRVGIATMSLYRYFETKNDLVRTLWGEILERAFRRASDAIVGQEPFARLRAFLAAYIEYWLANEDDYWLVFCLREDPGLRGQAEQAASAFVNHLELLTERCLPPLADASQRFAAHAAVRSQVIGLLHLCIALPYRSHIDRAVFCAAVLDELERGLRQRLAQPTAPR